MAQPSNQYFPMLPSLPGQSSSTAQPASGWFGSQTGGSPYQVPSYGGSMPSSTDQRWDPNQFGGSMQSSSGNLGHGIIATGLQYPGLSQGLANYLFSQIGQGMLPFNLQTMLPSGGQSQPGQLTADLNPILQQLLQFYQGGGSSMPGANTLSTIANEGISALPEWQSMVAAMQPNIAQNEAQMREQFAGMGGLAGSPFGTALSNYQSQTALGQNALLAQLQQQNILQGQLPAAQALFQGGTEFGGGLQALDQQAIQNMYQEFQRVQPQNNPLMQYIMGLATMYPPTTQTPTTAQSAMAWTNTIANVLQSLPTCPAEGSLILMFDETTKPVETLVPGDEVMGIDQEPCVVESVPRCIERVIEVKFSNGLVAVNSLSHAYALPKGGFVVASEALGKIVQTSLGPAKVEAISEAGHQFVFNILTDGSHTYCADGVWALGVGDAERPESMLMADMIVP